MGQGGCGGERNPQAAALDGDGGRGAAAAVAAAAVDDGALDCPGGQRYLSNAEQRKRFTRTDAAFDNAWGSSDVQIGGYAAAGVTARFGGQCGDASVVTSRVDDEDMQRIHEEASAHVEFLGKVVWR